jgi:hypothetical protein
MAAEITVVTDPLIVYGMVGLLLGALVLALIFSRPRRGLGPVKRSDVPGGVPAGEPWLPTGDIFGRDPEPAAAPPTEGATPPTVAATPPPAPAPAAAPVVHDSWSTGAGGEEGAPPPWGRR